MTGGDAFRRLVDKVDALEQRIAELEAALQPTPEQISALARIEALLKPGSRP